MGYVPIDGRLKFRSSMGSHLLTIACLLFCGSVARADDDRPKNPDGLLDEPAKASSPDAGTRTKPPLKTNLMPFSSESIRKVIAYHQDEIQSCYEETLANQDKPLEGTIIVTFSITPEGLVKKATVKKRGTTLRDPKFHDCVVAVVTAMTFPKPPDGRDHPVEYPYNLKAIR